MLLLSILFYAVVLLIVASIWWYWTIPSNLPPGPRGLPFIGSALDTWKSSIAHKKLQEWAQVYGPLYKLYIAEKLVVVLGDYNVIREALVTHGDAFAGRPHLNLGGGDITGNGLVHVEGEKQKIQRRFALSTLRDFGFGRPILEPIMREHCAHLLEEIEAEHGAAFEPNSLLPIFVNGVIYSMVFGPRADEDADVIKEILQFLRAASESPISILTPFAISQRTGKVLSMLPRSVINRLAAFRSRKPTGRVDFHSFIGNGIAAALKDFDVELDEPTNYVQAFRKAQRDRCGAAAAGDDDDTSFTEKQLARSVVDLFAAGTDTTATTLSWALFYMAHNPNVQEHIYAELKRETGGGASLNYADRKNLPLTEAAIMETQRLANLIPLGVMHRTMSDCKLRGYDIPAGTAVVVLLTAALYDPKVYPNPETFDPTRFLVNEQLNKNAAENGMTTASSFVPFSLGKRSCLGESLAKMELFHFFTALVSHFKFSFPKDEPIPAASSEQVSIIRAPAAYKICAVPREAK